MSTKFTLTRLANAPQARLRIYSGGHQVHVDLEPFDLEELVRDSFKIACELGHNPFPQAAPALQVGKMKSKRKQRRSAEKSDDWQD